MTKKVLFVFFTIIVLFTGHSVYRKREQLSLWLAMKSSPPEWAEKQIAQDLSGFQSGITQEALDETFRKIQSNLIPAYRYRVIDGKIFRTPTDDGPIQRAATFDKMLKRIGKSGKLPNLDFILCVMDGVPEYYVPNDFWIVEKQAPLLTWAKTQGAPHLLLIPDFLTTKESGWHRELAAINESYAAIPWEKKEEKAFWRGASNDKGYTLENYHQKPRFLVSYLAKQFPELVDAGFINVYPEEVRARFNELNLFANYRSSANHLTYKYLPVLDGYTCTYTGFQWRLLSGSLPFKQESPDVQYFYSALKPYEHYVPVKNDMSDLIEKITWAKAHDSEARKIAENARAFALENLMPNQIYSYLYWALKKYASLQTFDHLEKHPDWKKVSD